MPTPKYTALATTTLTSTALTVTFASIPSGYRDLRLVMSATNATSATATDGFFRINGDTGSNYARVKMTGTGTSAVSVSASADDVIYYDVWSTSSPVLITADFLDYSQTDKHKSVLFRGSSVSNDAAYAMAVRWGSTAAINSIAIYCTDQRGGGSADSFAIGSTFTLYGVK